MNIEFKEFPKIARLSRECVITEKLDGTSGCVLVGENGEFLIGSRSRWITPEQDNHGFAHWAMEHKAELMQLGHGRHYGEWWGSGINRGYGLTKGEKRWWLFNTIRWCLNGTVPQRIQTGDPRIEKYQDILPACCGLVPVLWRGIFSTERCDDIITALKTKGSAAVPGYMNPEGIVVFHIAGNVAFKKTIEKDEVPKSKS